MTDCGVGIGSRFCAYLIIYYVVYVKDPLPFNLSIGTLPS